MIRTTMHTAAVLAVITMILASCRPESIQDPSGVVHDGYVVLQFNADVPNMEEVSTRSVDPDGGGVQDMTLFCFDNYGLFITTVTADVKATTVTTGTFTAEVPENTRVIHFVANQIMTEFKEDQFRNKSESEVMALLEGSSGRMIYWARFACDKANNASIDAQIKDAGNNITMLRNHAQVSVANPEFKSGEVTDVTNPWIEVTGFVTCNTNAFGTVAPYHPEKGFAFTWNDWKTDEFVTIPLNGAKMSDITDVTTATHQYVFECENSMDDPVSIIIRGHLPDETEELYYRIMLVDENGEQIRVRRNHHYKLNIAGPLSFGQKTFDAALTAAATNNVWISISDNVNEVENQDYILSVAQTYVVVDENEIGNALPLYYTITNKNGMQITESDKPEITWIDNSVARQNIGGELVPDKNSGNGTILLSLLPMGDNEKLEGTLLVKKGQLQRKIKVITVKKQSFIPSWVSTAVYGKMDTNDPTKNRSHVTLMFTIPETCPAELFPMKVYISVGDLDIRSESGMELSVVCKGDNDWYSSGEINPEPSYKYVWTVNEPGVQRIYFENILNQTDGYMGTLHIEAEHFNTMTRTYTFLDTRKSITVEGLSSYSADASSNPDGFARDEYVLYRLVPQKLRAPVTFDLQLQEKKSDEVGDSQSGTPFNASDKDEFLLYSQYLNNYIAEEEITDFDCKFAPYASKSETWWKQNNPDGGRMLMFKPVNPANPSKGTGKYSIYMYTNRAKSAEVVRIATNLPSYPAVSTSDPDDTNGAGNAYGGNAYRSVTFELANYNPFRFGARIQYDGGEWQGSAEEPDRTSTIADIPETLTSLTWTYQPDRKVDIAIDITSFKGSDEKSVDPFGEPFEIYIDAPMLSIDGARLAENKLNGTKLKADQSVPGRFIYTVDKDRENERTYGMASAENKDDGANQQNERKILPFITNTPVSAGDITISSNEEQVVYYSKTFHVANSSITGTITYKAEGGQDTPVPAGAFVAFEKESNDSRIGSVAVTDNGQYELRLRKEYAFNWYTDQVRFHYELNGKVYHGSASGGTLANLFSQPNVLLVPED